MNLSTGFQEGWLNNLNNAITLDPNRLDNLQCTRNEDGFEETPSSSKKKKARGDVFEVNGGRIVRSVGRKDRHSKVCTARGTRDLRVRLSPNTAIQFYDVQDRLGYDRPSKAIDWLMKEAKSAIDAIVDSPRASCANSSGFNQTGNIGFLNSSSVFQNECPRNSYNQGVSASLQTWQNGTFRFSGDATSNTVEASGQHQIEFTQPREPLQSSFFSPAVPSSSSSMQFSGNQNANYMNNGFSYEFLSRLEEHTPISRNPSLNNSLLQE